MPVHEYIDLKICRMFLEVNHVKEQKLNFDKFYKGQVYSLHSATLMK